MTELLEGQFHNKELPAPKPKRWLWIIAGLAVLALIGVGVFFAVANLPKPQSEAEKVRAEAWLLFQEYLAAAKNHDLEKVKSLSYQTSEQCKDPAKIEECNKLMDGVADAFGQLKETELPYIWYDAKQLVLRSEVEVFGIGNSSMAVFAQLVFARDQAGALKVLGGNPAKTVTQTTDNLTEEEVLQKLKEQTTDTDEDGVEDVADQAPAVRDADGDGWWDGVEKLFR